jgi:protein-S-isoprenylcysteine O-methyltransferase Ste14
MTERRLVGDERAGSSPPTAHPHAATVDEAPLADPLQADPGVALRALIAYGHFIFRYRNAVVPVVMVLVAVLTGPRQLGGDARTDVLLAAFGLLVSLCGQALRVLVIGLAYIQRGGINKRIGAKSLVTDGVFAHCRHPLYVGNFLLFAGLMLIWNAPAAYVFGLGGVGLSLYAMARAEEAFLHRTFGAEYALYCRRVNRFVPDMRGITETIGRFRFDWKRALRKDYGTAFAWMTTAILLLVVKHVEIEGAAVAGTALRRGLLAWLGVAALWGLVRWLKKTRRLRTWRP